MKIHSGALHSLSRLLAGWFGWDKKGMFICIMILLAICLTVEAIKDKKKAAKKPQKGVKNEGV